MFNIFKKPKKNMSNTEDEKKTEKMWYDYSNYSKYSYKKLGIGLTVIKKYSKQDIDVNTHFGSVKYFV